MFYAHFVLAKKGPLSRIWLAAHWDKKLTKAHVFETNIEESVNGILQPKVKMALRTSGHLLLGVVRIYSRKAKYLLADCNEAFVKIKMAFRPGMVDLPDDNREAAINAITLPEVFHDFDTEMPDLNDVDIHAQFTMNQTRAEEITMREDYGNINLETEDNGFGDGANAPGTPEMLRENDDFGPENISLAPPESTRDFSVAGDYASMADESIAPSSTMFKQGYVGREEFTVAGSVAGGTDVMTANLFEEGSLFEDVPPTMSPSERDAPPMTESFVQDFPSVRSPASSHGDDYRPATPMDDHMSPPASPTPSQHSIAPSVAPSMRSMAPSEAPPPSTVDGSQSVRSVAEPEDPLPPTSTPVPESPRPEAEENTTTLIHNEVESFALAPIELDATTMRGITKAKRKRKLVVDEIKAITGEEMKAQLSDTSDIVTTLDLAPPTKRLMHWKETGGVEKLFALPSRTLYSNMIFNRYTKSLRVKPGGDEPFEGLPVLEDDPNFSYVEEREEPEFQAPLPPKRENRGRKRKVASEFNTEAQSEYMRYQEELIRATEQSAKEERDRQEKRERQEKRKKEEELEKASSEAPSTPARSSPPATPVHDPHDERSSSPPAATPQPHSPTPSSTQQQDDEPTELNDSHGLDSSKERPDSRLNETSPAHHSSPARSHGGDGPASPGYHEDAESHHPDDASAAGGVPQAASSHHGEFPNAHSSHHASSSHHGGAADEHSLPPDATPRSRRSGTHGGTSIAPPVVGDGYATPARPDDLFPIPPRASLNQSEYTDQWVEQAATETATGTAIPPPQTPMHGDDWGNDNDENDDNYLDDGMGDENIDGDEMMGEEETIESFEDRVLNKRAAQLHRNLSRKFEAEQGGPLRLLGMLRRSENKKQAATKFYSCLVLSKVRAVEIDQEDLFSDLVLNKTDFFEGAASSL